MFEQDRFQSIQTRSAFDAIKTWGQAVIDLVQLPVNRLPFRFGMNQSRIRAEIVQSIPGLCAGFAEKTLVCKDAMLHTAAHQCTVYEEIHHGFHE